MQWFHTIKCNQKFCFDSFISRESKLFTERKQPLPQNMPISITSENVQAILDSVESDHGNYLNDAMEDSYTEFVVEDNEDKHKDQDKEDNLLDTPYYNQPRAIVFNSADGTNIQSNCPYKEKENGQKEIDLKMSTN